MSYPTPEEVTSASSKVTESDIRKWFADVTKWLDEHKITDTLLDPSRVFDGDETFFYLHPKTKEVIALEGSPNVYEIEQSPGKRNVTVMFSFSASGATYYSPRSANQKSNRPRISAIMGAWPERKWSDDKP